VISFGGSGHLITVAVAHDRLLVRSCRSAETQRTLAAHMAKSGSMVDASLEWCSTRTGDRGTLTSYPARANHVPDNGYWGRTRSRQSPSILRRSKVGWSGGTCGIGPRPNIERVSVLERWTMMDLRRWQSSGDLGCLTGAHVRSLKHGVPPQIGCPELNTDQLLTASARATLEMTIWT
jgi:hypothetical protein